MLQKVIYDTIDGFGFKILDEKGKVIIEQGFKPGVAGFVSMTEEEANTAADEALFSMLNPPPSEPVPEPLNLEARLLEQEQALLELTMALGAIQEAITSVQ